MNIFNLNFFKYFINKFFIHSQIPSIVWLISLIKISNCGPATIPDNASDKSKEASNSYIYDFDLESPYWHAFSPELKHKFKEHDRLEKMLNSYRHLDFKIRTAWTVTDKPIVH